MKDRKQWLRQEMKCRLLKLDARYMERADAQIAESVMQLEAYRRAEVIFCYVGTAREIDTRRVMEASLAMGKIVGIPRCLLEGRMEVRRIMCLTDTHPGVYGIPEPDASCPVIPPEKLELAIVPCLSCSTTGIRLGHGGGYYDRYLAEVPGCKIALCRELLLCDEIPMEAHDLLMDLVLTENRVMTMKNVK
ncbi:MAG: 5-formyltetrahydrofolate cyclo-ligase [Hungatella sp.]